MWNAIKKFEEIQKNNENVFNKLNELFGFNNQKEDIVSKYKKGIESGEECKPFGTEPNNLFWSEVGSPSGQIRNNPIKDITQFVSKRELRCYDFKKDPYKIAWLFSPDAKFEAEKIWGNPNKNPGEVYFKGTWKDGEFNGILVEPSKFEGGTFKGTKLGSEKTQEKPSEEQGGEIKNFSINIKGLEFYNIPIELLDSKELKLFDKIKKDIESGVFLNMLKKARRLIVNGELDGYGNFPTLKFLFPTKGENAPLISKEDSDTLNYLILIKKIIIDNIIKKDGTPNEYFKKLFINNLKNILGITSTKKQKTQKEVPTQKEIPIQKPLPKINLKEKTLSVKKTLLSL